MNNMITKLKIDIITSQKIAFRSNPSLLGNITSVNHKTCTRLAINTCLTGIFLIPTRSMISRGGKTIMNFDSSAKLAVSKSALNFFKTLTKPDVIEDINSIVKQNDSGVTKVANPNFTKNCYDLVASASSTGTTPVITANFLPFFLPPNISVVFKAKYLFENVKSKNFTIPEFLTEKILREYRHIPEIVVYDNFTNENYKGIARVDYLADKIRDDNSKTHPDARITYETGVIKNSDFKTSSPTDNTEAGYMFAIPLVDENEIINAPRENNWVDSIQTMVKRVSPFSTKHNNLIYEQKMELDTIRKKLMMLTATKESCITNRREIMELTIKVNGMPNSSYNLNYFFVHHISNNEITGPELDFLEKAANNVNPEMFNRPDAMRKYLTEVLHFYRKLAGKHVTDNLKELKSPSPFIKDFLRDNLL